MIEEPFTKWTANRYRHATRIVTVDRKAIELRYRLLPEIYNAMHEARETGIPALRPAFLEFPSDPATWDQDDQLRAGARQVSGQLRRRFGDDRAVSDCCGASLKAWRHTGGVTFAPIAASPP